MKIQWKKKQNEKTMKRKKKYNEIQWNEIQWKYNEMKYNEMKYNEKANWRKNIHGTFWTYCQVLVNQYKMDIIQEHI